MADATVSSENGWSVISAFLVCGLCVGQSYPRVRENLNHTVYSFVLPPGLDRWWGIQREVEMPFRKKSEGEPWKFPYPRDTGFVQGVAWGDGVQLRGDL
jgi:hypothetical protein